jgi:hypothetical protein
MKGVPPKSSEGFLRLNLMLRALLLLGWNGMVEWIECGNVGQDGEWEKQQEYIFMGILHKEKGYRYVLFVCLVEGQLAVMFNAAGTSYVEGSIREDKSLFLF